MTFQPVIKWTGSKRSQSSEIIRYFPRKIECYREPFLGGGSILRALLDSPIEVERFSVSDINEDLIYLWLDIKRHPVELGKKYEEMWHELNVDDNIDRKKEYYNIIRDRCNRLHDTADFLFISRTTVNGLIRYNKSGNLNNSFHLTRSGIVPETMKKIIFEWSSKLQDIDIEFYVGTYDEVLSEENDFLYLDPPYSATKGIYYGTIDYELFWNFLRKQKGKYLFSFDGKTDKEDYTIDVPKDVYSQHKYLFAGNSSFRRIIGNSSDTLVSESIYIK